MCVRERNRYRQRLSPRWKLKEIPGLNRALPRDRRIQRGITNAMALRPRTSESAAAMTMPKGSEDRTRGKVCLDKKPIKVHEHLAPDFAK